MQKNHHSFFSIFYHIYAASSLLVLFDFMYHLANFEEAQALSVFTILLQISTNLSTLLLWLAVPLSITIGALIWIVYISLNHCSLKESSTSLVSVIILSFYSFIALIYFNYWLEIIFKNYFHITFPLAKIIAVLFFIGLNLHYFRIKNTLFDSLDKFYRKSRLTLLCVTAVLFCLFTSQLTYGVFRTKHIDTPETTINSHSPNIIFFTFDGMRAEDMSLYGYKRNTTPFLKTLGSQSIVFNNAISPTLKTTVTFPSIFYGAYLSAYIPGNKYRTIKNNGKQLISFPELLKKQGYNNYSYVGTGLAKPEIWGLKEHFASIKTFGGQIVRTKQKPFCSKYNQSWIANKLNWYSDMFAGNFPYQTFEWILTIISKRLVHTLFFWSPITADRIDIHILGEVSSYAGGEFFNGIPAYLKKLKEPFFIHMHSVLPHEGCYIPRKSRIFSTDEEIENNSFTENCYHDYMHRADQLFGEFYSALKKQPYYKNTALFISSDHGYMLFKGHEAKLIKSYGWATLNKISHVPLVIHWPQKFNSKIINQTVSTMDIGPTILELCSIPPPVSMEGFSLKGLLNTSPALDDSSLIMENRLVYSCFINNHAPATINPVSIAVYKDHWKFNMIQAAGVTHKYLYDRSTGLNEAEFIFPGSEKYKDFTCIRWDHAHTPEFEIIPPAPQPSDSSIYTFLEDKAFKQLKLLTNRVRPFLNENN